MCWYPGWGSLADAEWAEGRSARSHLSSAQPCLTPGLHLIPGPPRPATSNEADAIMAARLDVGPMDLRAHLRLVSKTGAVSTIRGRAEAEPRELFF